ncbi:MAG: sulfotransferase [Pseudomonadota bacterium]
MKVIGIGLNKTGTKTLAHYFRGWGMRHHSFDLDAFRMYRDGHIDRLLDTMEMWDSFEDWPWPLIWRQIDERYPDARFVLTVRSSPEAWFRSLCNMAVRMGPLRDYEQHIYGHAMPQGHREEHLDFYRAHNRAVAEHFADQTSKLVTICWEEPEAPRKLADFLGYELLDATPIHVNPGARGLYSGDNLWVAHACRLAYRPYWHVKQALRRIT